MKLPAVLSEFETIRQALAGKSLARYGDGELRLMAGRGTAVTQEASPKLAAELRDILKNPPENCLVCLPIAKDSPKAENWAKYQDASYQRYFGAGPMGPRLSPGRTARRGLIPRTTGAMCGAFGKAKA